MSLAPATPARTPATTAGRPGSGGLLRPGWPLAALFLGFPVWWALGVAQLMFFVSAVAMVVILRRRREPLKVPHGFALWVLFLVWLLLGMFVLRAQAPETLPGFGASRVVGYVVRAGWYAAVTVAMLYVVNVRELSTLRIVRLLASMFVVTTCFGVLATVAPQLEFRSPVEMLLPQGIAKANFVATLVHPTLASTSEFLGYEQPRPTAPFPYSNAWGNNLALFLPFFVLAWFGRDAGWRRKLAPLVLVAAVIPVTFSLNRGLWIALAAAAAYAAFRLAVNGRGRALQVLVAGVLVGGTVFVASPLYDTVTLRVETPHSNERRASTAETVVAVTATGSPVVGYGSTRTMQGSFASLAGGETESCHQCAAPPLGTQGFMWRLVLTTGFVGTLLCLAFLGVQFLRRARGPSPLDVTTCSTLLIAVLCFFVYDSLGSALFTVGITVGLMARASEDEAEMIT